jgi:hypothetical protein
MTWAASAGLSLPHLVHSILISLHPQFFEQRLGIRKIGGVEAFSEPAIDFGKHGQRFILAALLRKEPREAGGRAQLVRFCAHPTCERDCLMQNGLGRLNLPLFEVQFAAHPQNLRTRYCLVRILPECPFYRGKRLDYTAFECQRLGKIPLP